MATAASVTSGQALLSKPRVVPTQAELDDTSISSRMAPEDGEHLRAVATRRGMTERAVMDHMLGRLDEWDHVQDMIHAQTEDGCKETHH